MTRFFAVVTGLLAVAPAFAAEPFDPAFRPEAERALRKAVTYFRTKVTAHGGYPYYVAADLSRRWGEGEVSADTALVQPPGTPTVGMAFLAAFAATGAPVYRDAAQAAAEALAYGQLESGGWTQTIQFAPKPSDRNVGKYRNGKGGSRNTSSLDDDQTQSALRFLARADAAFGFKHPATSEAAKIGIDALLKAQFANGAFPQVWTGPSPAKPTGLTAKYPETDWKTEGRVKNYWDFYTLNDGLAGTVAETLIVAHAVYKDERYLVALRKLGDFLIAAQMPESQPAWCQQYNFEMVPIWARKFEPPAVTGWESQDVLATLVTIARTTGDPKFLTPVPKALAYLRASRLPDGKLARFYELRTNKPLYMDAAYRLTYDPADAPGHYGWTQPSRLDAIERDYLAAKAGMVVAPILRPVKDLEADARRIVAALDADGRWVSVYDGERLVGQPKFAAGFRYLSSAEFARNIDRLSAYLSATRQ